MLFWSALAGMPWKGRLSAYPQVNNYLGGMVHRTSFTRVKQKQPPCPKEKKGDIYQFVRG